MRRYTVAQVAKILSVPPSRVYFMLRAGHLPFIREGARVVFDADHFDVWVHKEDPDDVLKNDDRDRLTVATERKRRYAEYAASRRRTKKDA